MSDINNYLFIGTGTVWYNDFVNMSKNLNSYIKITLNRLFEKYNKYLNSVVNKNNNSQNILNATIICNCHICTKINGNINGYNFCHGIIIKELIKNISFVCNKYRNYRLLKYNSIARLNLLKKLIFISDRIKDIIIPYGKIINSQYTINNLCFIGSSSIILKGIRNKSKLWEKEKNIIIKISQASKHSYNTSQKEIIILNNLNRIKTEKKTIKNDNDIYFPKILHSTEIDAAPWLKYDKHNIIIMEEYGSDLFELIKNDNTLSLHNIQRITRQIAKTVIAINENFNIIHRDIKPENIVLRNKGINIEKDELNVVLIDYGLSTDLSDKNTVSGTIQYLSPEDFLGLEITKAVDVWALGISLFEMYTCACPFFERPLFTLVALKKIFELPDTYNKKIVSDKEYLKINKYMSKKLKDMNDIEYSKTYFSEQIKDDEFNNFIKRCLDPNVETRITMKEILEHDFLKKNYSNLIKK